MIDKEIPRISALQWHNVQQACKHLRLYRDDHSARRCHYDIDKKKDGNNQWCRLKDCPLLNTTPREESNFHLLKEPTP